MKRFYGFLKKEFLHIFRDVRTMMILFLIPIFQVLIFGFVVKNEVKDAKIAILDLSNDHVTHEIIAKLDAANDFEVVKYLDTYDEIEDEFRSNKVKEVIVFENNFAENLLINHKADVQIILDASDPNLASLINSYTVAILNNYSADINLHTSSINVSIEPRMWFNENLASAYMFVPGTMALILMLITVLMGSVSIVREKEMGTMEILLISPIKPIHIMLGKLTPYLVLSMVNAVSIILLGNLVFDVPILGSWILLLFESFLFILMALSLGLLVSTVTSTQQSAMFISMYGLLLPTMLLSGFIFPIENMPIILQYISYIVPARYFLVIIKSIMLKGQGLEYFWQETLILLTMAIVFISVSIAKFKNRLE